MRPGCGDPWLRDRLEELAGDVGRLRRCTRETAFCWRIDAIADQLWFLVAATMPTAAELYRECGDVEVALEVADQETRWLNRLLGDAS